MLPSLDLCSLCQAQGPFPPADLPSARSTAKALRELTLEQELLPMTEYLLLSAKWLQAVNQLFVGPLLEQDSPVRYEFPAANEDILMEFQTIPLDERADLAVRLKPGLKLGHDFHAIRPESSQPLSAFAHRVVPRKTDLEGQLVLYYPVYRVLCASKSLLVLLEYGRRGLVEFDLQFDGACRDLHRVMERAVRDDDLFGEVQVSV